MSKTADLPRRSEWFFNGFRWYACRYVRKHFHAVRVSKSSADLPETDLPLIIVMNHPSWWDPMIAVVLSRQFPNREHYAPIESLALQRYKFFTKLGFFGIEPGTARGATTFLRVATELLGRPHSALWITGQGDFRDVRQRPIELRAGTGFLAQRLKRGLILPLAVEYVFWQERTPEALTRWGEPLDIGQHPDRDGRAWTEAIEEALTRNQDVLAREAISRDPELFDIILSGKVGVGGMYDMWRRMKAWLRGRRFEGGHEAE